MSHDIRSPRYGQPQQAQDNSGRQLDASVALVDLPELPGALPEPLLELPGWPPELPGWPPELPGWPPESFELLLHELPGFAPRVARVRGGIREGQIARIWGGFWLVIATWLVTATRVFLSTAARATP